MMRTHWTYRFIALVVSCLFTVTSINPVYAQVQPVSDIVPKLLPINGLNQPFEPMLIKGLKVNQTNPFEMEFIVSNKKSGQFKKESARLIKYFLAALTIPGKDMWVNLSPYEKNRIIPESFGQTEMGRELLVQDYLLKQVTASLLHPDGEYGQKFWAKIATQASQDIPLELFSKVWIIPDKAVVYENGGTAYVVEASLKVMLERDYLAVQTDARSSMLDASQQELVSSIQHPASNNLIREIIIPAITQEVNESKNFAKLRQIYHSLILATWYKKKMQNGILNQIYVDQNKTDGFIHNDPEAANKIWREYTETFKEGAYNSIKEEYDPQTQQIIPKKYFSGGADMASLETESIDNFVLKDDERDMAVLKIKLNLEKSDFASLAKRFWERLSIGGFDIETIKKLSTAVLDQKIENPKQYVNSLIDFKNSVKQATLLENLIKSIISAKDPKGLIDNYKIIIDKVHYGLGRDSQEDLDKHLKKISEQESPETVAQEVVDIHSKLKELGRKDYYYVANDIFKYILVSDDYARNTALLNKSTLLTQIFKLINELNTESKDYYDLDSDIKDRIVLKILSDTDIEAIADSFIEFYVNLKYFDLLGSQKSNLLTTIIEHTKYKQLVVWMNANSDTIKKNAKAIPKHEKRMQYLQQVIESYDGSNTVIDTGEYGQLKALLNSTSIEKEDIEELLETASNTDTISLLLSFTKYLIDKSKFEDALDKGFKDDLYRKLLKSIINAKDPKGLIDNYKIIIDEVHYDLKRKSQEDLDKHLKKISEQESPETVAQEVVDIHSKLKELGNKDYYYVANDIFKYILESDNYSKSIHSLTNKIILQSLFDLITNHHDKKISNLVKLHLPNTTENLDYTKILVLEHLKWNIIHKELLEILNNSEILSVFIKTTNEIIKTSKINPKKEINIFLSGLDEYLKVQDIYKPLLEWNEEDWNYLVNRQELENTLKSKNSSFDEKMDLLNFYHRFRPVTSYSFKTIRSLFEQEAQTDEQKIEVVEYVVDLIRDKNDMENSFPYLRGLVQKIARKRPKQGESTIELTPVERSILEAFDTIEQRDHLIDVMLNPHMSLDTKESLLSITAGTVLDPGLTTIYQQLKTKREKKTFFELFLRIKIEFNIKPPALILQYLLNGQLTFENLKQAVPKVQGKSLKNLIESPEFLEKDNNFFLLSYFIFNPSKWEYAHQQRFDQFKSIMDIVKSHIQNSNFTKAAEKELYASIRKHSSEAEEIIAALKTGESIIPKISGMKDADGQFIPQPVNISYAESEALKQQRTDFMMEFNLRLMNILKAMHYIKNITAITNRYQDESVELRSQFNDLIKSIQGLGGFDNQLLIQLHDMYLNALKILPKFKFANATDLEQEIQNQTQKFLLAFKKKALMPVYGFRPLLEQYKIKNNDKLIHSLSEYDIDLFYRAFQNKSRWGKAYQETDHFEGFIKQTFSLIPELFSKKHFGDLYTEPFQKAWGEMVGHFSTTAKQYEKIIQDQDDVNGKSKLVYASLLSKSDILPYIRFGDAPECCLSSHKESDQLSQGYIEYMASALLDQGTHVILFHTENKPVGFILWHFAKDKKDKLVAASARLYLQTQYRSTISTQNIMKKAEEIMAHLGIQEIHVSDTSYPGAQGIPEGYEGAHSIELKRIQTTTSVETTTTDLDRYLSNHFRSMSMHSKRLDNVLINKNDALLETAPEPHEDPLELELVENNPLNVQEIIAQGDIIESKSAQEYQNTLNLKFTQLGIIEASKFRVFIRDADIQLHVLRPRSFDKPTFGLNVPFTSKNKDLYAISQEEDGKINIYISEFAYLYGSQALTQELIAQELYKIFAKSQSLEATNDIDLERMINAEYENYFKSWLESLSAVELSDLGLKGQIKRMTMRSFVFGRLMGELHVDQQSKLTHFMRERREVSIKLNQRNTESQEITMPIPEDAWELMADIMINKKNPGEFINTKMQKDHLLYWLFASYAPVVFNSIAKQIKNLIDNNHLNILMVSIGRENQSTIDQYLQTGDEERLREIINSRIFSADSNDSIKATDGWLNIFKWVYDYNLMTRVPIEIKAIADSYDGPEAISEDLKLSSALADSDTNVVLLGYYGLREYLNDEQQENILIHIDPVTGFFNNTSNSLSYAFNFLLASREDLILEIKDSNFENESIVFLENSEWQQLTFKAGEIEGIAYSDEEKQSIVSYYQRIAPLIDKFNKYHSVYVSIPGEDGGDEEQSPKLTPETPEYSPVGTPTGAVTDAGVRKGGIDFNPAGMELEIKTQDTGHTTQVNCVDEPDHANCIQLHFTPEQIKDMRQNITGITPVIIDIRPMINLPLFLGFNDSERPADDTETVEKENRDLFARLEEIAI